MLMTIKRGLRLGKNFIRGRYGSQPLPLWLDFRITSRCNLHCRYCDIPLHKGPELNTEEVKRVIDKVSRTISWVLLTGGECLLRPDIGEIIAHIKDHSPMMVTVNTNMILLPDRFEAVKRADYLFFSIDGRAETHDGGRGPGSYAKVIEALDFVSRQDHSLRGLLSLTVMHRHTTHADIAHVLELSRHYGFGVNFQPLRHYAVSGRSGEIGALPEHQCRLLDHLLDKKGRGAPITNSTRNLHLLKEIVHGRETLPCFSGRLFCYLNAQGEVGLCFSRPHDERYLNLSDPSVTFHQALERLMAIKPDLGHCRGCTCTTPIELATFSPFDLRTVRETLSTFTAQRRIS